MYIQCVYVCVYVREKVTHLNEHEPTWNKCNSHNEDDRWLVQMPIGHIGSTMSATVWLDHVLFTLFPFFSLLLFGRQRWRWINLPLPQWWWPDTISETSQGTQTHTHILIVDWMWTANVDDGLLLINDIWSGGTSTHTHTNTPFCVVSILCSRVIDDKLISSALTAPNCPVICGFSGCNWANIETSQPFVMWLVASRQVCVCVYVCVRVEKKREGKSEWKCVRESL